jgi:hypothetical protein
LDANEILAIIIDHKSVYQLRSYEADRMLHLME